MKKFFFIQVLLFFCTNIIITNRVVAQKEFVQRILLDKPKQAGPLKVFPVLGDENSYYYLPNKLRLGTNVNGQPEFTFLQYVQNVRSGAEEKEAEKGEGGGYVHLLVGLQVTADELKDAQQELTRINSKGKIIGPVVYRGGTMTLITKSMLGENKKVLGIGPAPVLEGDKIAVAFELSKENATILWQTLKMPLPDISFNLNMTIGGYQSPVEFSIEMNFDKIYQHKNFNLGVAAPMLSTEIGIMAQQLKESGAIKVVTIGEDPNLQRLQEVITNKLIDLCFEPLGSQGSVNWSDLARPSNDGKSYLDRANEELNSRRRDAREENTRIREENRNERDFSANENRTIREENRRNDSLTRRSDTSGTGPVPLSRTPPRRGTPAAVAAASMNDRPTPIPAVQPNLRQEESVPSIQVVASYQQKKIHHTGSYKAEAKSYFTTTLTEPFAGNIGPLNCPSCIKQINLDDPLYKQREIVAFVDGVNADDFGKYINFVTVSMRKKHPGGDITTDEVRIDRKNFNKEGNNFKLLYGWMPGDNDRRVWLDYEYKTSWSFFGGGSMEEDWKKSNKPAINLAPPIQRRIINVMADQSRLISANVRSVSVKIYYATGGDELIKQVTLNPAKEIYNSAVEFMLAKNVLEYSYDIEWLLNDNSIIKSGRKKSGSDDLYVDVLPAKN